MVARRVWLGLVWLSLGAVPSRVEARLGGLVELTPWNFRWVPYFSTWNEKRPCLLRGRVLICRV